MATDAILILDRLHCIREGDGTGNSEPYIWPVLMWIDDNTLATPLRVGVTTPTLGNARVVIKNDMRAGESASIPPSVGTLRVRFEDGLTIRRLLLAVALWEEDETPETAMRAGFQAFFNELRTALADNLFDLYQAGEEQKAEIIKKIEARVQEQVESAIENALTPWQKVRVLLGTLNLDDIIGSDFKDFRDLLNMPVTLVFKSDSSNEYEIEGELQVRPVPIETCQDQLDAVKAAQSVVNGIDFEIRQFQTELQHASPRDKPFIISEIKRLRREELPSAIAKLEAARRELQSCRNN